MSNALDRLTAEMVMGLVPWLETRGDTQYVVWSLEGRFPWEKYRTDSQEERKKHYKRITHRDIDDFKHVDCLQKRYSTDPRDTFAVVDQLRAEGWRFALEDLWDRWEAAFVECGSNGMRIGGLVVKEHKDRLTAILLAALAVKGVSEDEVRAAMEEKA